MDTSASEKFSKYALFAVSSSGFLLCQLIAPVAEKTSCVKSLRLKNFFSF